MTVDLQAPRFTQADVLKLVPELTAKTLQNWTSRRIIEQGEQRPGRQGKRLYTPIGVIVVAFMARLTRLGITASAAAEMAQNLASHALELHASYPSEQLENGARDFVFFADLIDFYHRGYIVERDGSLRLIIRKGSLGAIRTIFPLIYITVEVDAFIFQMLNRIYSFVVTEELPADGVAAADPEQRALGEEILSIRKKYGDPVVE